MAKRGKSKPSGLPSEAELLEFVQASGGRAGKREIGRAFAIKGSDRIALKAMLKDLANQGKIARRHRRLIDTSTLPPIAAVEVVGVDPDGELIGVPLEWDETVLGKPPRILIEAGAGSSREDMQPPARGERILAKIEPTSDPAWPFKARIVRRLADTGKRVLGIFRATKGHGALIIPVDKKARHDLRVQPGDENGALNGELVAAEIRNGAGRGSATARVRERLGSMEDQRNISLIAIHQHGIPDSFPERVLAETVALKPFSPAGRTDLRKVPLITIDPPDARDHDDAVWAEPDDDPANPGGVKVIVAIADVAAYVRSGTALDREARIRGNSVYFPDRVVPMLPERISNDLCSLREKEDRPALACIMTFDASGTKRSHRFDRVIMRSAAKLSYQEAQAAIDGSPNAKTEMLVEPVLRPLWHAYDVLMKGRRRREPLELDLPERKLILDAHGLVERVVTPERLDAHKLIEEFMIQANVAAAETLEAKTTPLLYRIHEPPTREKLVALSEFLKTVGLSLPLGQVMRPKHFNRILAAAAGKEYQHVVNEIVLRTQAQAVYAPENKGHFGLTLRRYAHFTSPIRRYADLIVHRGLISALGLGQDGLTAEDISRLPDTADLVSGAERRAMAAERETIDRLIAAHLAGQTGSNFRARISGVVGAGLFVTLTESGADGFVPVSTLGREYFVYDQTRHALIGEKSGETFQLGDRVEVRLIEATPVSGGMRFEMVSEGRSGKPASPLRRVKHGRRPR
ncbi:MAG: ribonuclease R [Hyphomicrobiales bacterium]